MIWNFAYTPQIWPAVLTTLLLIVLALYAWYRRYVPGAIPFAIGSALGALWMAGYGLEIASVGIAGKIFWVKFQAIWQLPATTAITCFILEYAWPGRWVTRRVLVILSVPLLAFLVLTLTNNSHHLLWQEFVFDGTVIPVRAPLLVLFIIYGYLLFIVNIIVLVWLFWQSPPHRWAVVSMLIGQIGFRSLYFLDLSNIFSSDVHIYVLGISILIFVYAIVLFGFRIFDPIPLARRTMIEQQRDGMLVLDPQGQVVYLNAAAEQILGTTLKKIQNKPISLIIPSLPALSLPFPSDATNSKQIQLKSESKMETRSYELDLLPLNDFRGLPIGFLFLLHDVTGQVRSQAQILEQQRALATMNERERLARELHDELSQQLAAINVQAQLVDSLLEVGQVDQAHEQLQRLAKTARETQVDVRGEIHKLSKGIAQGNGFLGALRQYIGSFQQLYGIDTELNLPVIGQAITCAPLAEVQLLRIVQEAFTNIRKHAFATHVCVTLVCEAGFLKLMIKDDGVGFDQKSLYSSSHTFGLGIMSERAEEVNGRVEVTSAHGKGTQVTVVIPLNSEK